MMMIQKKTALFFLLIANFVILVHAVVPHHHHNNQICIQVEYCLNHNNFHQHETAEHNQEHDANKNNDCCSLKQVVVVPSNTLRQECIRLDNPDINSPFDMFQAVLLKDGFQISDQVNGLYLPHFFITSSYTQLLHHSLGLRAPPTV